MHRFLLAHRIRTMSKRGFRSSLKKWTPPSIATYFCIAVHNGQKQLNNVETYNFPDKSIVMDVLKKRCYLEHY